MARRAGGPRTWLCLRRRLRKARQLLAAVELGCCGVLVSIAPPRVRRRCCCRRCCCHLRASCCRHLWRRQDSGRGGLGGPGNLGGGLELLD